MSWICSHCAREFGNERTRCPDDNRPVVENLSGQIIAGRYELQDLVGVGGMDSTVWRARQIGIDRIVAVKVMPPADEPSAKRFARGAKIAANLNHPNCTVVHDYGRTEDGKLFLVMEFLKGSVLRSTLETSQLSVEDSVHILDQVLLALEHAHKNRAVHRDLKPDNLFLTQKNNDPYHVKILDFGIAKYIEEDPEATISGQYSVDTNQPGLDDFLTEQRQVCGTPQYMAPEQVVGGRIDGRTDLYALACVAYRMLVGALPFDGRTRYELYRKHLQETPPSFADVNPYVEVPDALEAVVMKALRKRPEQRYKSAAEMRKALLDAMVPEEVSPEITATDEGIAFRSALDEAPSEESTVLGNVGMFQGMMDDMGDDDNEKTLVSNDADKLARALAADRAEVAKRRENALSNSQELQAAEAVSVASPVQHPKYTRTRTEMAIPSLVPTDPSSAGHPRAKKKSGLLKVLVILAASFLVGAGSVVGILRFSKSPETGPVEGELTKVQVVDTGSTQHQGLQEGEAPSPAEEAPAEVAREKEEPRPAFTISGLMVGNALADVKLEPSAYVVHVDTLPSKATLTTEEGRFTTPAKLTLEPGVHHLNFRLYGYQVHSIELDVPLKGDENGTTSGSEPIMVTLVKRQSGSSSGGQQRPSTDKQQGPQDKAETKKNTGSDKAKANTSPQEAAPAPPPPAPPKEEKKPEKPKIRLLE